MTRSAPFAYTRPPRRPRWGRVFSFVGAWIAIIAIGRLIVPAATRAETDTAHEGPLVGTLVSRDYVVRITATPSGPRYSVSTLSGQVLQTGLDSQALAKAFPRLDPANLQAIPGAERPVGALLQADTGEKSHD